MTAEAPFERHASSARTHAVGLARADCFGGFGARAARGGFFGARYVPGATVWDATGATNRYRTSHR